MDYVLTDHALLEMKRRAIPEDMVREILASPEQTVDVRPGRVIRQSRVWMGDPPKHYLVRVIVDIDRAPPEVVTAYRTSRIEKYWRGNRESEL